MSSALRDAIFWIAVASCAVSQLFIIRAAVQTASRPSSPPSSSTGNDEGAIVVDADSSDRGPLPTPRRSVEIFWAILPVVLMIAAFTGAWRLMHPETP